MCGFLGPNGAGKTTTLRILLGLAAADVGAGARRPGGWAGCSTATASIPAAPRATNWHWRPPAPAAATPTRRSSAPAWKRVADTTIGACSYGTRRRLALAAALLDEPDVLLLDEPATGLDPHALRALRTQLRTHADGGGTVLLSSHVLEEVAATCDRVVVVERGRRTSPKARSTSCSPSGSACARREPDAAAPSAAGARAGGAPDGPGTVIVVGADPDTVGRAVRDSGAVLHEMSTQGALEALYVGLTEAS